MVPVLNPAEALLNALTNTRGWDVLLSRYEPGEKEALGLPFLKVESVEPRWDSKDLTIGPWQITLSRVLPLWGSPYADGPEDSRSPA